MLIPQAAVKDEFDYRVYDSEKPSSSADNEPARHVFRHKNCDMANAEARHEEAAASMFQGWALKSPKKETIMRPYSVGGLFLLILGVLALSVHSVTYFTTEQVAGPLGFFAWDVSRPHTIFINPIAGIVALAVGIVLVLMPGRQTAT